MLFYILPYLLLVFCAYSYYSKKRDAKPKKIVFIAMLLPAILLVILRGDVGTDTLNYLQHFEQLTDLGVSTQKFEPGFDLFTKFLVYLHLDPRLCVAIIGFLTIVFFIQTFCKSKESILFFALLVFPSFFYDMTMNGIRYGLSFAIAGLAIKFLYENRIKQFILFALLAISIQYSSFLIIFAFSIAKLKIKYIVIILLVLMATFPLYFEMFEYIFLKQEAYSKSQTPSALSGIGPMFMFLCLYILYLKSIGKRRASNVVHIIFIFELFSFYIGRSSYAGLRLQSLFMFCLLLFMVNESALIKNKIRYHKFLLFFGFISFCLWLKNYVGDVEVVAAPYIPYKFFWSK